MLISPAWAQTTRPADAQTDSPAALAGLEQLRQMQEAFAAIGRRVSPSVVAIQAGRRLSLPDGDGNREQPGPLADRLVPSVGSGVIIDPAGFILTNEHVVHEAAELTVVLANRHRHAAKLIGSDSRSDLAVIRIEAAEPLPAARMGDARTLRQGHWSIAMGNPFGLAAEGRPAMTVGIISAVGRVLPTAMANGDRHYGNLIQTSADINPGNSGGPLLNLDGEVIGINTAISSLSGGSEGVGFAIPITPRTRAIIAALKAGERIEYGFLGVVVRSPRPEESAAAGAPAYAGALIDQVEQDTPAAKCKLQAGDIVVAIDGEPVDDSDHLVRLIGRSPVGQPISIVLWRGGKRQTVSAVLEKRSEMIARRPPDQSPALLWRGMIVGDLSAERRKALGLDEKVSGVEVIAVQPGSPAAVAGVRPGDVLDSLDKKPVTGLADLRQLIDDADDTADLFAHLLKGGTKLLKAETKH